MGVHEDPRSGQRTNDLGRHGYSRSLSWSYTFLVNGRGRFLKTPRIIKRRMIGKGLLGYQSEGFIFLDGYQIQRRVLLVIQASQLVPKNPDLASAKAWISFI